MPRGIPRLIGVYDSDSYPSEALMYLGKRRKIFTCFRKSSMSYDNYPKVRRVSGGAAVVQTGDGWECTKPRSSSAYKFTHEGVDNLERKPNLPSDKSHKCFLNPKKCDVYYLNSTEKFYESAYKLLESFEKIVAKEREDKEKLLVARKESVSKYQRKAKEISLTSSL